MNPLVHLNTVIIVAALALLWPHVGGIQLDILNLEERVPDFHDKLGKILKSCFSSRLNTLVVSKELSEVAQDVSRDVPVNLILIDKNFDTDRGHGYFPRWPMFLLGARSEEALTSMLQKLKSSDLWNSDSTFFVVNNRKNGCDSASRMLLATWDMNLLAAFYICKQHMGEVLLYTYNPFTKRAIRAWKKIETESDDRWTLHRRYYSSGPEMCENLEFDKTKFLDHYQIKAVSRTKQGSKPLTGRNDDLEIFEENSYFASYMLITNMLPTLKMTAAIYYESSYWNYANETYPEYLRKVLNNTHDVIVSPKYLMHKKNFVTPRGQSGIAILTNHRGFLTPVEKMARFYSLGAIGLTCLAMFITWIIFVFRNNGRLSSAALEVLRIVLSTSVLQPLQGIPVRIYLFGIWWLVIILNATFQGHICAFLTKPERFDVETLADLRRYNYHIYINPFYFNAVADYLEDFPQSHLHIVPDHDCYKYVLKNPSAACIQNTVELIPRAIEHNLHLSVIPLRLWLVYYHRHDWPLAQKMNQYVSRIAQAGLLDQWSAKTEFGPVKKIRYREERETDPQIRKLRLGDLTFAFILLGIGLAIAALFLLLEIYQAKKQPSPKSAKRKHLSRRVLNRRRVNVV